MMRAAISGFPADGRQFRGCRNVAHYVHHVNRGAIFEKIFENGLLGTCNLAQKPIAFTGREDF
jgi:hypothetical protein